MFIQEVLEVHKNHLKLKRVKYDENTVRQSKL